MKATARIVIVCIFAAILTACNFIGQQPTPEPTTPGTEISSSIFSNVPTVTPRPMETSVQSSMLGLPMPSKVPNEEWQGIRIMPDAIAGDEVPGGYYFAIDTSVEVIQAFYDTEMYGLGWDLIVVEQGTIGNKMMIFKKDNQSASISITPQSDGNVYVMITV